ncbi:unnamed protein product [Somion occarium]|uniref:Major facilitator superfamily (MFS) profile domain-containing protein n=1 Tax=Somion occarium TaxID=3059160 RepID=A0ABP1DLN4_9APHY
MNQKLKNGLIITTICCVIALSIFLTGATAVAITSIGRDLKFKQSDLQWPINVYSLSYGCLLLLCGRLADIIGNKKMFLMGSAWFSLWSVAAAVAPNSWTFILFLGLLGIGPAASTPASISIISSYFPPGKTRNQAFAILGAGQPIGFIVGMILGGLLSQSGASWRAIFALQAGLGCLLCVVGWIVLPTGDISRRYDKGLDIVGAVLSTAGLALLVYDLGESTSAPKGWATPFIPSLLSVSVVIIVLFVLWELWREAKGQSVLLPMSMWIQPGTKMGPVVLLVIFGWWGFNTMAYYAPLYYQQVQLLSPLQTSVRLVPLGVVGLITNLLTGYLVAVVPAQALIIIGFMSAIASSIIFSLINVHASYWAMAFIVMCTLPIMDIAYTIGNMQVCFAFDGNSQAVAGSIFSIATRLGTSIGLAVTSSIASSVSEKFNRVHPDLVATDPDVLMAGYRAAGWTCCGALVLSLIIAIFGMRGIGLVGQRRCVEKPDRDIELSPQLPEHNHVRVPDIGPVSESTITQERRSQSSSHTRVDRQISVVDRHESTLSEKKMAVEMSV